jgi:hypothetical protein
MLHFCASPKVESEELKLKGVGIAILKEGNLIDVYEFTDNESSILQ